MLILKDKLRITLEWIHSQGRAAEHGTSLGLSMAENSTECRAASANQRRNRAARIDRAGTHYTAKHCTSRTRMRDNQRGTARAASDAGEKDTDTEQGLTSSRESATL